MWYMYLLVIFDNFTNSDDRSSNGVAYLIVHALMRQNQVQLKK